MRPSSSLLLSVTALVTALPSSEAFVSPHKPLVDLENRAGSVFAVDTRIFAENSKAQLADTPDCECGDPTDSTNIAAKSLVNQKGSAEVFRSSILSDVNGNMVHLGEKMGDRKSVVIFLRHLG